MPIRDEVRLFIALELPTNVQAALQSLQDRLRRLDTTRAVRWTATSSIHLTLKFIGETASSNVATIRAALIEAANGHSALDLAVHGVGVFPNYRKPRIVWAGLEGMLEGLQALRDSVEKYVAPLGFPTESRPFSPHLTIGRARQDASTASLAAIGSALQSLKVGEVAGWRADRLSLMQSDLKSDGAVYTALAEIALIG